MHKIKCLTWAVICLALCLVFAGCGKKDAQTQAFDQTSPEIKAAWDAATAADKTNDFYTAASSYAKVLSQESKLTPRQLATLETASRNLSQRMLDAANIGDESAKQALKRLMAEQNRR